MHLNHDFSKVGSIDTVTAECSSHAAVEKTFKIYITSIIDLTFCTDSLIHAMCDYLKFDISTLHLAAVTELSTEITHSQLYVWQHII